MWLTHGKTSSRAERIVAHGTDGHFAEPGGIGVAENFCFAAEGVISAVGDSVTYPQSKAAGFPNERGPAILPVDVTEEVVRMAAVEDLSLFGDLIQYDQDPRSMRSWLTGIPSLKISEGCHDPTRSKPG